MTNSKRPGRVWAITDLHLKDRNILGWSRRPENWEAQLRRNLHRMLLPGDRLILMGDTYVGSAQDFDEVMLGEHDIERGERLRRLIPEGVQVDQIEGNHDSVGRSRFEALGWRVSQALVVQGLYISHHGSRHLPDDARGQLLGHYHQNPANPLLPHALRLSVEERGYQPVLVEKLLREMERGGLLRELPERVDDRWFLREMTPQHPWKQGDRVRDPVHELSGTVIRSEANRCTVRWDGELAPGSSRTYTFGEPLRAGIIEPMQPERARELELLVEHAE